MELHIGRCRGTHEDDVDHAEQSDQVKEDENVSQEASKDLKLMLQDYYVAKKKNGKAWDEHHKRYPSQRDGGGAERDALRDEVVALGKQHEEIKRLMKEDQKKNPTYDTSKYEEYIF